MTPAGKASKSKGASKTTPKKGASKSGKSTAKGQQSATSAAASSSKSAPSSVPRRGTRARLAAALEKLDKLYGVIAMPETRDILEKAVCLLLREVTTPQNVAKALEVLRSDFVDWNEVRVSSPSELSRLLSGSGRSATIRRWDVYSRRVREMIDQVYNDKNVPTLEFLLEQKAKEQLEYLEDLDDLCPYNAYALVQWLSGDDKLTLVSSEMGKACLALGLTDSAAVTKVKKELGALCSPEQLVSVQAHLNQFGALEPDEYPAAMKEFLG